MCVQRENESLHTAGDTAPVNFTALLTSLAEASMKNFDYTKQKMRRKWLDKSIQQTRIIRTLQSHLISNNTNISTLPGWRTHKHFLHRNAHARNTAHKTQKDRVFFPEISKGQSFLGLCAQLRKGTISFIMSARVCLSVRMEQIGSHRTDFHEIWYLSNFRKSVQTIQISFKSNKNNRHFTWRPIYVFDHISLESS